MTTHYHQHQHRPRIAVHFEDGRNEGVQGVCKVLRFAADELQDTNRLRNVRPFTVEEVVTMLREFADRIEGRLVGKS